jgi:citrate lyase subunit beta/citryl-CoA lyase
MLFVPGNSMRRIYKAGKLEVDAVILDLEDAVPLSDKETARIFVRDSIGMLGMGGADVFVRVNALSTGLTEEDLWFTVQEGLTGVVLPKCESKGDVSRLEDTISKLEAERGIEIGSVALLPLIETPRGLINAYEIATSSSRIIALGFGAVDFTRELGTRTTPEGVETLYARSHLVISATAAGIQAIDTPWVDLMDMEGLIRDARLARQLGFRGKMAIHPRQIRPLNEIFTPSDEEIRFARLVVEEFEKAQAAGRGAISVEGTMIDLAGYKKAKELLSLIDAIERKRRIRLDG